MSLFPTLQRLSPKATLLYDCFPGMLTRQAPSQFGYGRSNPLDPPVSSYYDNATPPGPCPAGAAVVCWQRFTGADPITEFDYPSFSPLFAIAGGSQEGFGAYITDQYFGLGNPGSQAGLDASTGITTTTNTVRGVPMQTLKMIQYNHVQNGFQGGVQSHFLMYRNIAAPGFVDLTTCCIEQITKIPDHSTLLSQTYRYRSLFEFKTTNDFRIGFMIIMANSADAYEFDVPAGKLGYMFFVDNNLSTSPQVEYIRMKNFKLDALPTDFTKYSIYWHRAADYNDLTTGRIVVKIDSPSVGEHIIFDINAASVAQYNIDHPLQCTNQPVPEDCVNRHMGVSGHPVQRIFQAANYHGGVGGVDVQFEIARLSYWSDAPFYLP